MDWSTLAIIVQLIFLEGILSIDNAAVLGAMAAPLPADQPIPWPPSLSGMIAWGDRVLGMQREAALKVGLLGAYVGRFLMLLAASFIVRNPWLRLIGAIYLIYLAVEHIAHLQEEEAALVDHVQGSGAPSPQRQTGFWATVLAIELADLAFSLDNVVAAITLSDRLWVVMLGVALGIVTMRFAATIFARLILWEPALQTGAYLLVFSLGIELVLKELLHFEIGEYTQFFISVAILIGTVLIARSALAKLSALWTPLIGFFRLLYAPFGMVVWVFRLLTGQTRAPAAKI